MGTMKNRPKKSRFKQRAEYLMYRAASSAFGSASDARVRKWGTLLGRTASAVLLRRTKLAVDNVERIFPEKSRDECARIVRACWEHFGRMGVEYLRAQELPLEEIAGRCEIVNRELLDKMLAMNRGLLMITAHFGSWEIGGQLLSLIEGGVTTVARPLDNELLERDLTETRVRTRIELVDKKGAARTLVRALEKKRTVVLLPDQAVRPHEGILVPFLGRPAWTTAAPAKLALRFGTPILFVFCVPRGESHLVTFDEPIVIDELSPDERSVEAITTRINHTISKWILQYPELWLWMHNRWKGTE
ncbi:MAG TPA: lysophospholipid acyltransferase family protein [Thermoanaerobaculia bacterium]|nr:lysophospholipid acyltransferase family protein [Thermoanaerobaculia bacterium]